MAHINLHDRAQIEKFLRQNPHLHLYEIGDLDDYFWRRRVTSGDFFTPGRLLESGGRRTCGRRGLSGAR